MLKLSKPKCAANERYTCIAKTLFSEDPTQTLKSFTKSSIAAEND